MTILSARGLAKAYGPQSLMGEVSLTLEERDRVCLLGVNGSGKSTMLRLLAGLLAADSGVIDRRRGARILYLPQEPELDPAADARTLALEGLVEWHEARTRHAIITRAIEGGDRSAEVIAEQARLAELVEGLGGWERDHVAAEVLQKLGVTDIDRPVGTMSGGERRRVALARVLIAEPDLAILDEPTNHLDTAAIEWLEERLVAMRGALLLVTHDRYVLDAVATRVLELDQGRLREFTGGYADYLEQKATLLEHEARVEANAANFLRRERAWLMRGARARTTKQKARIQRAEEALAAPTPKEQGQVKLDSAATRTGGTVLELHDVGVVVGGRTLVKKLTLHMVKGDRIGIVGPNGIGKTSLLRVVGGELEPSAGRVVRGTQTRIAYFDQARSNLEDGWSIFDNVAEREGAERTGAGMVELGDRTLPLRTYLEQFLFDAGKQRQKVGSLSGGERARVALAKLLRTGSNLLLLDEPTNDLDIATLSALEEMLSTWPGCALVVTHDRYFLNRVATSILGFLGDGEVVRYAGGYDAYRAARLAAAAEEAQAAQPGQAKAPPRRDAPSAPSPASDAVRPLTYAERLELDAILDVVAAAEADLAKVERELSDPTLYAARGAEVKALQEKRSTEAARVRALTERWEMLEARRDAKR